MARVIGGLGISHSPSMGVEFDRAHDRSGEFDPAWQPWSDGSRPIRNVIESIRADHLVVIYNDHLNYFGLDNYPTFAIGVGESFRQADEGWPPRDIPDLIGQPEWGIHLATQLVVNDFDMTICKTSPSTTAYSPGCRTCSHPRGRCRSRRSP